MAIGVSILGSTGSIGESTLQVLERLAPEYHVVGLTCHRQIGRLCEQAALHRPLAVAVADGEAWRELRSSGGLPEGVRLLGGLEGVAAVASIEEAAVVVNGLVGAVGLRPTLEALRCGKRVALANKETLVMAGEIVMETARTHGGEVLPVDSEHSALFQVLHGHSRESVRRVILTASGGPFRTRSPRELDNVTVEEALQHPTWEMGKKITVDSATLANKGLEVIEAHHLFGLDYGQIDVVVHPQSIIHSLVELVDGSLMAHMGLPDMRLPIQFAITYPHRASNAFPACDLTALAALTFEPVDPALFPSLGQAYAAGRRSGTAPSALNAANEVAVQRFLAGEIPFRAIPEVVGRTVEEHPFVARPGLPEIFAADAWARERAAKL